MHLLPRILITFACLVPPAVVLADVPETTQSHAHMPPAAAAKVDPTAPAAGWPTDAPLRAGMGRIRHSVDALERYRQGHMVPEQARLLAGKVERDVAFLVANCRLDPAADAALHRVIAELLRGASAFKRDPRDVGAIDLMRKAVDAYARSFDDPAFPRPSPAPARTG